LKGSPGRTRWALVGVGDHLGDAVYIGADDARAEDHGLEQHAGERFLEARAHEDVGEPVEVEDVAGLGEDMDVGQAHHADVAGEGFHVEALAGPDHDPLDLPAGELGGELLLHEVDGADEDVLALALADGADVDDEDGVGVEGVFGPEGARVVGVLKGLDAAEVDPAAQGAEVVVDVQVLMEVAGGAGGEDDAGGEAEGLLDAAVHQRGEQGGEEALHGVALVDVERGGLAEPGGEVHGPEGGHRVADEDIGVIPVAGGGETVERGGELARGFCGGQRGCLPQLDLEAGLLEAGAERAVLRRGDGDGHARLFGEIAGELEDEDRRALVVEVVGDDEGRGTGAGSRRSAGARG
jgi:hypothetical protein